MAEETIRVKPELRVRDKKAEAYADILETRAEMAETFAVIQARLTPQTVREQVTEAFDAAKDAVKGRLIQTEQQLKAHVTDQIDEAKDAVRNATIGRVENMVHSVGDTIGEARFTVTDTVRRNPIPAAMIGLGLGWLLFNGQRQHQRIGGGRSPRQFAGSGYGGYTAPIVSGSAEMPSDIGRSALDAVQNKASDMAERVQDVAHDVAHSVQDVAHKVSDRVQHSAHELAEHAGEIADRTQVQARVLEERVQHSYFANPIAFGGLSLAIGAALGMLLPKSRREEELLGDMPGRVLHKAEATASDVLHKAEATASEAIREVADTAKRAVAKPDNADGGRPSSPNMW